MNAVLAWLLLASPAMGGVSFATIDHAGDRFHVVEVDPSKARIRLHWRKQNSADAVREEAPSAVAVTNAGISEPDFTPTGLLVVDGKQLHGQLPPEAERSLRAPALGLTGNGNYEYAAMISVSPY